MRRVVRTGWRNGMVNRHMPHSHCRSLFPLFSPQAIRSIKSSTRPSRDWSSCFRLASFSIGCPRRSPLSGRCVGRPRSSARSTMAGSASARSRSALQANSVLAFLECHYWIRKLQARFFAGDYAAALEAADKADTWYATSAPLSLLMLEKAEYHFYAALARAASMSTHGFRPAMTRHREALEKHKQQLRGLGGELPAEFRGPRSTGRRPRSLASRDARSTPWTSTNAPSGQQAQTALFTTRHSRYELAARFYAARGFEEIAHALPAGSPALLSPLGSRRKGAAARRALSLAEAAGARAGATGTIEAPVEQLDIATVIKVSQALSGEMVLEKLIDRLMRAAIEHAGAERGLLITPQSDELRIEAEATTRGQDVIVRAARRRSDRARVARVTRSLRHAHARKCDSRRRLARKIRSATDPYVIHRRVRSVLCLPFDQSRQTDRHALP